MSTLIDANIAFIEQFNEKLAPDMREAKHDVVLVQHQNTKLEHEYDLEFNGKLVAQEIISSSANALKSQLEKPKRILMQRLLRSDGDSSLSSQEIFSSIIDSNKVELVQHLDSLYPSKAIQNRVNQSLDSVPPNLVLIGALSLVTINDLVSYCPGITSILLIETSINQLLSAMQIVDLRDIVGLFKSKGIKFNLIYDPDLADNSASLSSVLRHFANLNPLALHSLAVFRSPVYEASYELIFSWLQSPDGFGELVKGYLGNETDEINQSLHAISSALYGSDSQVLIEKSLNTHDYGAILTASGPSLDEYLDLLKAYQHKVPIVCAGSSFGSLLRAGIVPAAAVLLEMSSLVYYDLLDLMSEGIDLSEIYAFVSATVDPRIHALFKGTIVFHRPMSSSVCLFDSSLDSALPQAGPQVVNAAMEVLVHLGYRNLFLCGCDFGGPSLNSLRSKNAMGKSNRKYDIPVMGGYGRTIMTNNELSVTRQLFENIARIFDVNLNIFGEGSKIEGAYHVARGAESSVLDKFSLWKVDFVNSFFQSKSRRSVNSSDAKLLASGVRKCVGEIESQILEACAKRDKILLKSLVSDLLIWSDDSLSKPRRIVQRIIRYPLFFIGQSLADFDFIAQTDEEQLKHWTSLQNDLSLLLNLLRHWCNCIDDLCMTASVENWSPDWLKRRALDY